MAGHRRGLDGRVVRPTKAVLRHQRRKRDFAEALGKAHGPREMIAAASDIIRRAVGDMPPHTAAIIAGQAVDLARQAMREACPPDDRQTS